MYGILLYIYIYTYTYTYVYIYVCLHIYRLIYIYTYTYIHVYVLIHFSPFQCRGCTIFVDEKGRLMVVFAKDGNQVLVSYYNTIPKIFDASSGACVMDLEEHPGVVLMAQFT